MAGIGNETVSPDCSFPLPVEPRKRFVFTFHSPNGPGLNCPLVTDYNGVYFRREGLGGLYISGLSPEEHEEPDDHHDLESINHDFFDNQIWPSLAKRVKSFEELKLRTAWAGHYDYNYVDHNLVIGSHPYFKNFLFANGSTGHGLQHSPAVGRAISELIMYGEYRTVDLNRLGFNRFLDEEYMTNRKSESNIY